MIVGPLELDHEVCLRIQEGVDVLIQAVEAREDFVFHHFGSDPLFSLEYEVHLGGDIP